MLLDDHEIPPRRPAHTFRPGWMLWLDLAGLLIIAFFAFYGFFTLLHQLTHT